MCVIPQVKYRQQWKNVRYPSGKISVVVKKCALSLGKEWKSRIVIKKICTLSLGKEVNISVVISDMYVIPREKSSSLEINVRYPSTINHSGRQENKNVHCPSATFSSRFICSLLPPFYRQNAQRNLLNMTEISIKHLESPLNMNIIPNKRVTHSTL